MEAERKKLGNTKSLVEIREELDKKREQNEVLNTKLRALQLGEKVITPEEKKKKLSDIAQLKKLYKVGVLHD